MSNFNQMKDIGSVEHIRGDHSLCHMNLHYRIAFVKTRAALAMKNPSAVECVPIENGLD